MHSTALRCGSDDRRGGSDKSGRTPLLNARYVLSLGNLPGSTCFVYAPTSFTACQATRFFFMRDNPKKGIPWRSFSPQHLQC